MDTVNNALSQNLTQIVTQVVTAVGILVMMFTTSPILAAIAVVMVPVSLLASLGVMKTGGIHYARQQELLGQLNGYIEEVYQGQELVSVFNYTDRAKEEFDRINGELQRTAQSAEIASGKVTPITDLVNNLGYAVSALLGIGAGLIIPLSTGLISRYFTGTYRVKQFGYSSAITNVTLVVATAVTGYLAEVNWHLPFLVYLLPLVAIILTIHLKDENMGGEAQVTSSDKSPADTSSSVETAAPAIPGKYGIHVRHLLQLMLFYGLTTYIVLIVTFNLPFLMEAHHFSSGNSGMMISLFFLAIMAPGFFLGHVVKYLKEKTKFYSLLCIALGLALIWISPKEWLIIPGCILVGLGYGVIQPLIYDKTSDVAVPHKVTLAFAFVMAMNYVAILLCPFIVDAFQNLFHSHSQTFAFWLNLMVALMGMFIVMKQEKLSL